MGKEIDSVLVPSEISGYLYTRIRVGVTGWKITKRKHQRSGALLPRASQDSKIRRVFRHQGWEMSTELI